MNYDIHNSLCTTACEYLNSINLTAGFHLEPTAQSLTVHNIFRFQKWSLQYSSLSKTDQGKLHSSFLYEFGITGWILTKYD